MKLVAVLMLTALPLYCYEASGCETVENLIGMMLDRNVSVDELTDNFQEFIPDEESEKTLRFLKQGLLYQSEETLEKIKELKKAIYSSFWCARY